MKKKYCSLIILFIMATLILIVSGCKDRNENEPETQYSINLNETDITLERYAQHKLNAVYNGNNEIVWSSSDANVANIINGVVIGISSGNAEIKAQAGDIYAVCSVQVSTGSNYPNLNVSQDTVEILEGKNKTVSAELAFKGIALQEKSVISISYLSSNTEIAAVSDDGDIKGITKGQTEITVKADYAGIIIEKIIAVTVKENSTLSLSSYSLNLYTNSIGNKLPVYANITTNVTENDLQIVSPEINWDSLNKSIAIVDKGKITAVSVGNTIIKASYISSKNTLIEAEISVSVEIPIIQSGKNEFIELDKGNYKIDLAEYSDYYNAEITNSEVTDSDGNNISSDISGSEIILQSGTMQYGFKTIYIKINSRIIFAYEAEIATKIIRTPEEMSNISKVYGKSNFSTGNWSGYYILGNNIDMSGYKIDSVYGDSEPVYLTQDAERGFTGLFDGKGYTLYNVFSAAGIFGRISKTGVVKNLSVVNDDNSNSRNIIASLIAGKLENIYISINMSTYKVNTGAIAYRTLGSPEFTNCVINIREFTKGKDTAIFAVNTDAIPVFNSVYIVSPLGTSDPFCSMGSYSGSLIRYSETNIQNFNALDLSNGYWNTESQIPVFNSSLFFNLPSLEKPDKTSFKLNGNTFSWNAVSNASGYEVKVNGTNYETDTNSLVLPILSGYIIKIKTIADGINYRDSAFSEESFYIVPQDGDLLSMNSELYQSLFRTADGYGGVAWNPASISLSCIDDGTAVDGSAVKAIIGYNSSKLSRFNIALLQETAVTGDVIIRFKTTLTTFGFTWNGYKTDNSNRNVPTIADDTDGWKIIRIPKSVLPATLTDIGFFAGGGTGSFEITFDWVKFDN